MRVQVLVASMHQTDSSLVEKMNLSTDAVIGNQCDRCSNEEYLFGDKKIVYLNRTERGVGLNRNATLLNSNGDILTFADDDMVFVDGYEDIIKKAFEEIPKADAIIFNIKTIGTDVGRRSNSKIKRVRWFNALNYGAARISVKANKIKRENVLFHTCFGGGTMYSSGEDSIFITDMLKRKLRLYVYPVCIASVDQTTSTWFNGYTDKYFHDKGALFCAISKRWAKLLCLQDAIRHNGVYKKSVGKVYKQMKRGIKAFKNLEKFDDKEN